MQHIPTYMIPAASYPMWEQEPVGINDADN
ncbi:hypothetical protein SAMN05444266_108228 [Chitinophaga jiangningensis]|uniref:Uncharacterized protein n=1 Tax=Chitinophaga jiangningensis TaxID=1419482 RepID=A0A1M7J5H4_9BACT|nr:hypothetical protein SAMN05444266_108228 [Chitinophaga jiangningensis]